MPRLDDSSPAMGSRLILLLAPFTPSPAPISPKSSVPLNLRLSSSARSSAGGVPRSRWDTDSDGISDFEFSRERYFAGFGSRRSRESKRRNWWSDEASDFDEYDEDYDDDDDWFGLGEQPSIIDWFFKVFRAFGWMLPAVVISMLLGTGSNTLFMALALPLGQTAISLVDKIWGSSGYSPDPKPRSKRRPFVRSSNKTKPGHKTREEDARGAYGRRTYQSWTTPNGSVLNKGGKCGMNFGGWDELDKQGVGSDNIPRGKPLNQNADEHSKQVEAGKLSRRRNREKPLFLRLLIAVFPFLGSWSRFFL